MTSLTRHHIHSVEAECRELRDAVNDLAVAVEAMFADMHRDHYPNNSRHKKAIKSALVALHRLQKETVS